MTSLAGHLEGDAGGATGKTSTRRREGHRRGCLFFFDTPPDGDAASPFFFLGAPLALRCAASLGAASMAAARQTAWRRGPRDDDSASRVDRRQFRLVLAMPIAAAAARRIRAAPRGASRGPPPDLAHVYPPQRPRARDRPRAVRLGRTGAAAAAAAAAAALLPGAASLGGRRRRRATDMAARRAQDAALLFCQHAAAGSGGGAGGAT